jgi:hypothetical protein
VDWLENPEGEVIGRGAVGKYTQLREHAYKSIAEPGASLQ